MRFARVGAHGREVPVVNDGDAWRDLRPITSDISGAFLADRPVERTEAALAASELPVHGVVESTRFGPPIAKPSAIVCMGMNYAAHAAESGSAPPEVPVVFLKTPNTIGGPNDDVVIPRNSVKTDWEVELGVVIGRRAAYLDSAAESFEHIAGFLAANDISERHLQLEVSGGQWSKGKCADGFSPIGPWLVTPEEVDHSSLRLQSFVNGRPRQDSSTSEMIFGVDEIVWHLSQFMTLEPGDLVLTGTPKGVALSGAFPYLTPGDVVEIEIQGLGHQRQTFSEWSR